MWIRHNTDVNPRRTLEVRLKLTVPRHAYTDKAIPLMHHGQDSMQSDPKKKIYGSEFPSDI